MTRAGKLLQVKCSVFLPTAISLALVSSAGPHTLISHLNHMRCCSRCRDMQCPGNGLLCPGLPVLAKRCKPGDNAWVCGEWRLLPLSGQCA